MLQKNQTKNQDKEFFSLSTKAVIKTACLNAISCKEGNLPNKIIACYGHFEETCFECLWWLQNGLYCTDTLVQRKLNKEKFLTTLPNEKHKDRQAASLECKKLYSSTTANFLWTILF